MKHLLVFPLLLVFISASAQDSAISSTEPLDSNLFTKESLDEYNKLSKRASEIKFEVGAVDLENQVNLNIPAGFKFLKKNDAEWVVFDLWGNPRSEGILGMIVKEDYEVLEANGWAFVLSFEKMGYVKDDDAAKINYDELLKEMQQGEVEENKERVKNGFSEIHMLGWASRPYYDKTKNTLHWAKSLKFSDNEDTTLNYDVRVLGRYGILSMNAVGTIGELDDIKASIPEVVDIARFNQGNAYKDFDSGVDEVAAVTIGGLVAGKLLAKAGILALFLKNIKLIILAIGGAGAMIWKKIKGKKQEESIANS
jgi:uncharacterized membrane-anchored protein